MRGFVVVMALVWAGAGHAQGVARWHPEREVTLWSGQRNATMVTSAVLGTHVLPATTGFRTVAVTGYLVVAAATATGTMTLRITDGTNNCDTVVDCTTNDVRTTGPRRWVLTGVCSFAPGAALTQTVAAQCGTAQPQIQNLDVVGFWR